ncbi:MAG TPA: zinc metalloprotease HtpX [Microthrixaceae bacterium]|nr:zinc metalloprotease HtpX [Microthrixaceae bacterium]
MLNNAKTAALLAGLGGLIMAIGAIAGGQNGLVFGLVIALVLTGGSYWFSDKLAIASARAQEVTEAQFPQYYATMRDLTQRAGIPMPRLYVAPSPQPNAFATGRNPSHAAVCVNEGLMQYLTWEEISGVLAHEISHVRNRDILTSSVAAAIAMAITFAARMAMWGAMFGGGRDERDGGGIGDLLMIFLAPVAATVIQLAVSRSREYEADASAARLLGTGEPLARALEKLEMGAQRIPVPVNQAQAQAYIVNPLRAGSFAKMFSTHPSTADRIGRLRGGAWR